MKKIKVFLNKKTGEITVTAEGFSGPACLAATLPLEQALGNPVSDERTAEFYATAIETAQDQEQSQ